MPQHEHPVSVVIPVYNASPWLAEAIDSVLAQTQPAAEIIVVDDGSTDSSAAVTLSYGGAIRYTYQPNAGIAAARNRGVALAGGELLAFLDADDLWLPAKLALQTSILAANRTIDMVFGHMEEFFDLELDAHERERLRRPDHAQGAVPARFPGTLLIRRTAFERVGYFSPELRIGEFLDWYSRAQAAGLTSAMAPELVLRRRIHRTNTTRTQQNPGAEYLKVLRAGLQRQRQGQSGLPAGTAGQESGA